MQPLERLLLDALNPAITLGTDRLDELTPEQWQEWLALAAAQRVTPVLWQRLKQKGVAHLVPEEAAEALKAALSRNALRNLRLYGELRTLLTALETEDIPVILLKGIYLADAVYGNVGFREMSDIDLLARPGDLRRIAGILTAMGYESPQPICPDVTLKTCHHLPRLLKSGYAGFEIHWNLMEPKEHGYVTPDGFWERAETVRIAGCDALALSPEDLLLHLCFHTSYHHQFAFGLRPSCDIAAMIARFGPAIDWQIAVERAGRLGWSRGVYLALYMSRDLVGAEVPAGVLERLQPADMAEAFPGMVRRQILSGKEIAATVPDSLARLLETGSLLGKCRIFLQRVFVSKDLLASSYSVPADSVMIYGCYPRRVFDLLRRHGNTLNKYREGDHHMCGIVNRKNRIIDWLSTDLRGSV